MRKILIITGTLLLAILLVLGACAPSLAPPPPPPSEAPAPETTAPPEKVGPPPGELARLGDFSVSICSVQREEDEAVLHFAITKVTETNGEPHFLPIVLIDDHGNEYSGTLGIDLEGASEFVLSALPRGFTYIDLLEIYMPVMAPIEKVRLGDKEIAYERIKFGDPQFLIEFDTLAITKYQSVEVGEWLSFTMEQAIPELPFWKLPITIENKEYNPISAEVGLWIQNRDGTISWGESGTTDVPAQSKTSVRLSLALQETPPQPRILVLEYIDQRAQEHVLKVFPMPPGKLLPFVVSGKIYEKWGEKGFTLGLPTGGEESAVSGAEGFTTTGQVQNFQGGQIYYITTGTNAGQAFDLRGGPLLNLYVEMQSSASWLGFPVMDEYTAFSGYRQAEFEAGYIASPDGSTFRAFSYGQGMIAFVSDRDGNEEVYVTDPSGRNQTNLTRNPANDWDPAWSPDGQKIAFVSDRQPQGIYLMNADGTNQRFLTEGDAPSWFPDGSKIIFTKPGTYVRAYARGKQEGAHSLKRIFTIKVDGSDIKEISPDPSTASVRDFDFLLRQHFARPAISPDGSEIAFAIGKWGSGWSYDIHLMNMDGTGLRRLVETGWGQHPGGDEPSWSPDGRRIAHRGDPGNANEIVGHGGPLHTAIPGTVPDTNRVDFYYAEGSKILVFGGLDWAPDGHAIVFSGGADEYIRLYITHANERILRRLPGRGNNYQPAWGAPGEIVTLMATSAGKTTIRVKRQAWGNGQIETLDLESEYLPVVVASENAAAPAESLKAQAVASRSFALYKKMVEPRDKDYDVLDSEADQVYNPTVNVTQQHRQAVKDTEGMILKYAGKVICAFYVSGTGDTEKYVTYNEGKSGDDITQTSLGWVTSPPSRNPYNRGCMGQVQANELASKGYTWRQILKYFYGSDIEIERS